MPDTSIMQTADSFVVVMRWRPATKPHVRYCYETFMTFDEAVRYHRELGRGPRSDFLPHGIFAACAGLPVAAGQIPAEVIDRHVLPDDAPERRYGTCEFQPNSTRNMLLRQSRAA